MEIKYHQDIKIDPLILESRAVVKIVDILNNLTLDSRKEVFKYLKARLTKSYQ